MRNSPLVYFLNLRVWAKVVNVYINRHNTPLFGIWRWYKTCFSDVCLPWQSHYFLIINHNFFSYNFQFLTSVVYQYLGLYQVFLSFFPWNVCVITVNRDHSVQIIISRLLAFNKLQLYLWNCIYFYINLQKLIYNIK